MASSKLKITICCCVAVTALGLAGCAPKRVISSRTQENLPVKTDLPPAPTTSNPQSWPLAENETADGKIISSATTGDQAVDLARAQLGKPYQWGASGPDNFDCSGLVLYVYKELGVQLPRKSSAQASAGIHIDRQDLIPGDLVFFRLTGGPINHVGIYVGRGKFIHAPNKNKSVRFDSLNDSWWRQKFKGGRRVG